MDWGTLTKGDIIGIIESKELFYVGGYNNFCRFIKLDFDYNDCLVNYNVYFFLRFNCKYLRKVRFFPDKDYVINEYYQTLEPTELELLVKNKQYSFRFIKSNDIVSYIDDVVYIGNGGYEIKMSGSVILDYFVTFYMDYGCCLADKYYVILSRPQIVFEGAFLRVRNDNLCNINNGLNKILGVLGG